MQVRLPTGNDIVKLLLLCAPPEALTDLELSQETANEFACEFDEMTSFHQVNFISLALYYCYRSRNNYQKSQSIMRMLYFSPEVIHSLVETVKAEENLEIDKLNKEILSLRNRKNRIKGHDKPGGYGAKAKELLEKWATGKYRSRNQCAIQCCNQLGIAEKTARNHLQGTPDPIDWKAKRSKK